MTDGNTGQGDVVSNVIVIGCGAGFAFLDIESFRGTHVEIDTELGVSVGTVRGVLDCSLVLDEVVISMHAADFLFRLFRYVGYGYHGGSLFHPELVYAKGDGVHILRRDFDAIFDIRVLYTVTGRVFPDGRCHLVAIGSGRGASNGVCRYGCEKTRTADSHGTVLRTSRLVVVIDTCGVSRY